MRRVLRKIFKKEKRDEVLPDKLCEFCHETLPPRHKFNVYKCKSCHSYNFTPFNIDGIELEEFLSYGGTGAVFRSGDKAVKLVDKTNEESFKELLNEYEVYSSLATHSKHLLPIEAFFEADVYAGLITPYIKGGCLANHVQKSGPLKFKEGLELLLQITDAVQCFYKNHFLYPDLKPQNILLNDRGEAVLCDYGHVSHIDDQGEELEVSGTAQYLSPERITGQKEDCRSTIYSMGILIHYIFTGKKLFKEKDQQELAERHINTNVPSLIAEELSHLPQAFVRLVQRMTVVDMSQRLSSFPEFKGLIRKQLTLVPH